MNTLWYYRDMEPIFIELEHFSLKTRSNPIILRQHLIVVRKPYQLHL